MAKSTDKQVSNAKASRDKVNVTRKKYIAKMKALTKSGDKAGAAAWRKKAVAAGKRIKSYDMVRLKGKDKAGLKTHGEAVNKHWADKVSASAAGLKKATAKKLPASKIAAWKKSVAIMTDRQKKHKERTKKWTS
jgi:hypothetical protein